MFSFVDTSLEFLLWGHFYPNIRILSRKDDNDTLRSAGWRRAASLDFLETKADIIHRIIIN